MQYNGPLDELKKYVYECGKVGDWEEKPDGTKYMFRANTGELLNWWPKTGTISFQGKNCKEFESELEVQSITRLSHSAPNQRANSKIFIVHGHDRDAMDQLELILRRLGLEPFILQNSDSEGKTIVEALEKHISDETAFGIVLMTPDDYGYSKREGETEKKARARQNVILEMGMIMAKLGRSKMAILQKGTLERPSDTDGILIIKFNDHVRDASQKLIQRLQSAGFNIDSQKMTEAVS